MYDVQSGNLRTWGQQCSCLNLSGVKSEITRLWIVG